MSYAETEPILKGFEMPLKQTPGKVQYYYPENIHTVPQSILHKVNMPEVLPMSLESKKYIEEVEKEVLKYFERVPHNLFDPDEGINLDLTIGQARQLMKASEDKFEPAESGELQQLLEAAKKTEEEYVKYGDAIEEVIFTLRDSLKAYKKSIWMEEQIITFGSSSKDSEAQKKLFYVAEAQFYIAKAELEMSNPDGYETYDQVTFNETQRKYASAKEALDSFDFEPNVEENPFKEHINAILKDLPKYKENFEENEKAEARKEAFYSQLDIMGDGDHTPDRFKEDLLAYLSSAIILKEHKYRYQLEQYERFTDFNTWIQLNDKMTLKKFCEIYARSLRLQVDISHNFLCPKIDANYDDYGERTVDPINAAVFYFFFSGNRSRRKLAQVILSAVRYPNEKVRKAYLRFFSSV